MAVLLRRSTQVPPEAEWQAWCAVPGTNPALPDQRRMTGLAAALERAFDGIRDEWWALGKVLAAEPSGELGHAPTCTTYGSDMGLLMAWVRLVEALATESLRILVLCDDPWLFRQMAQVPGIDAGQAPPLLPAAARFAVRGWAARGRFALRTFLAALRTRRLRSNAAKDAPAILVYGHPASDAKGGDAYFGKLMLDLPDLHRMMHTDCPPARAAELAGDGRTASLHGFGCPAFALGTIFARWRPSAQACAGTWGWLVRRAAAKEGSGAAAATNRWQMHCQRRWLAAQRPATVAWPWENHPWERAFVRACRSAGVRSVGYQHTVVGPHMYNQSPAPNPDGLASIPERIICNGPAYRDHLAGWGIPAERLAIGGTFRFSLDQLPEYRADAPVFVALSSDHAISAQMMAALARDDSNRRFLVKDHPMFPFAFAESERLVRTRTVMNHHPALSAVVYSTGSVGLEALLAGLPTFRFQPEGIVAMNILPPGLAAIAVDAASLVAALESAGAPASRPDWRAVLAPADVAVWRDAMVTRA